MKSFTVGVVQFQAVQRKKNNFQKTEYFVKLAKKQGAEFVALPEVSTWRGSKEKQMVEAESLSGQSCEFISRLAKELDIYILLGSFLEKNENNKAYNTSVLFSEKGEKVAVYRKMHLFDVHIPGKVKVKESERIGAGTSVVLSKTPLATFGLSVCYDVRFPELYRKLSEKGAEVLLVPSAFTKVTGEAHWEPLLRSRAIENQCYVVASNQVGKNVHGFEDYGNSMIIDPWGKVLARASGDKEEVIVAVLDGAYLEKVREELPSLKHRVSFE